MNHADIYEFFKSVLPTYAKKTTDWFPCGRGAVRVRLGEIGQDFVFTYRDNKEWRFETVESFINRTVIS